ncbi:helix-turn-helix transcriptional regulator [Actinomadura rugatobispora]|uniref:AAA family ATPase n=1 Tax=Actinomadura rugatobispora TaxID=1994 RepID=A0ABW1A297_9ACTN|nr:helix-turn-helix transcriptional regulator [Actinomadura rugatobispora]
MRRRGRFVGRREQLALIEGALRAAEGGEPRFVVLGGDGGVGKTRLMEQVAGRLSESGVRVLRGACVELGGDGLPFAPFTGILREVVRDLGPDGLLPNPGPLRRLLGLDDGGDGGQGRLFEAVAALLERLGTDRATLLVIDDLQWADRSTRDLVGFLARTLDATRVLALLAFRSDALVGRHPLRPFLAELGRLRNVDRADLPPFDRAETAELIAAVTDDGRAPQALAERVFRGSGGNALFAEELVRADGGELPGSLRDLLLMRFGDLPEASRGVVRVASAGGPVVPHDLLAEVAGMDDEDDLLAAIRAARDAHVLVAEGHSGYAFRHALLREAVAGDLLPAERVRLHKRYAEALEARPELSPPDRFAAEVAFHWYEAGDAARALPALLRAAETAEAVYAHAEQARMLERALDLWERTDRPQEERGAVLEKALGAAGWAGENLQVLDLLDRALVHETTPERTGMLLAHRGMALHTLGRDGALTALDEALDAVSEAEPLARARVLDLAGAVYMLRGRPEQARDAAGEAARIASGLGEAGLASNAITTAGMALGQLGREEEALRALDEAGAIAERRRDAVRLARVHLNRAYVLGDAGRHEAAIAAARTGLDAALTSGLARTLGALIRLRLANSLAATGRWDESEQAVADALRADPPAGFGAMLYALRGDLALRRGDEDMAREQLALARTLAGPSPCQEAIPVGRLEAALALYGNRVEEARAALAEALAIPGAVPAQTWELLVLGARIEARAGLRSKTNTPKGVSALREQAETLAANTPLTAAYAAQFKADTGDAPWLDAVTAWGEVGDPYAASQARLRAAETAMSQGDRESAAELLRAATEQTAQLDARPLAEEMAVLARAARLAPSRPQDKGDQDLGLTGRETEVLRLITAGRSNRQIAEELFISPKTASVHVSRILGKLGVATRGEAAAAAHRLGLFPR